MGKHCLFVSHIQPSTRTTENIPDCTGVKTGVTLVNSLSKLLVSVALVIFGKNGGSTRLW